MNETQPKISHTEATDNNEKLFGKYNKEPNHDSDVVANQQSQCKSDLYSIIHKVYVEKFQQ